MINSKTVQPDDIERIKISESERTIEFFIPQIRTEHQNSSVAVIGGPSYTHQAIGRAKDVTEGAVGYMNALTSILSTDNKYKGS
ncbi:hypothetical protein [Desulforapulum autotrophicum]|uniref:hypothetical protein n=1 Tax=Desulforapulum autotrophicum TaxID=2296 RepID=UPI0011D09E0B|nr:hypothetical protein [Desulforapulum autotrophicum]